MKKGIKLPFFVSSQISKPNKINVFNIFVQIKFGVTELM